MSLLVRLALRNLSANFLNVIIGSILFFGTLLFVVGGSLIGSVNRALSQGIIGSVAGDAQIYRAASQDKPALFDNWNLPDLDPIPDFAKVSAVAAADPDVAALVPMGVGNAQVYYGNTLDEALGRLRRAVDGRPRAPRAVVESLKAQVRGIVDVIAQDYSKLALVASAAAVDPRSKAYLRRAASPAFWAGFDAAPDAHLEFLENRVAPILPDADAVYLHYVGTDLDLFRRCFDRLRIVDGTAVPSGQRGMLLSKFAYESQFKLKTAYRLDQIHEALTEQGRHIKGDGELEDLVRQNRTQTREILLQLDPLSAAKAAAVIRAATGSSRRDLPGLLAEFLDTDDADFAARYRVFYKDLAPLLRLYRLRPGDTLTIGAYTKSGYRKEVNVKVYGTYEFKGLEKSDLAGALSLMDLITFRELYGYASAADRAETRSIEAQAGAVAPPRADAEAALFGGGGVYSAPSSRGLDAAQALKSLPRRAASGDRPGRVFTPAQMDSGVCLEAAVLFKPGVAFTPAMARLQRVLDRAGLGLKVEGWRAAAGAIGQFVLAADLILGVATAIIFVVALVILNNAVVMATLQRVREIGTLRAIGAQKGFVLALVLVETLALGLLCGTAGMLAGAGVVRLLHRVGVPASNTYLYFFFSGPRLRPDLSLGSLVGAFLVVVGVTGASALYPALMATRVAPVRAMASED